MRHGSALAVLALSLCVAAGGCGAEPEGAAAARVPPIPAKTVVLTFDDAQRTHLTFVAPLLEEYGFGGTFFVSARWMDDQENYLSWPEVAKLHRLGFEVGNHSFEHNGMHIPRAPEFMAEGVPKPVSFAWPGGVFGPEALGVLRDSPYRMARRCMHPEVHVDRIAASIAPA